MDSHIQEVVNRMRETYELVRRSFAWEYDASRHLVSLQFALNDRPFQAGKIKELKEQIRSSTGVFSSFRGNSRFALCGLLAAQSQEPSVQLEQMIHSQELLRSAGFKNSQYLPNALYALSTLKVDEPLDRFVTRAYEIYREMKKNHPFLTSGDDYAFAILLASSNHSLMSIEEYYSSLAEGSFRKSNGLQMLSHIMAFGGKGVYAQTRRLEGMYARLKQERLRPRDTAYPALGLISLLNQSDTSLESFIELVKTLKTLKRYRWLDRSMLMLLSSAIITHGVIHDKVSDVSLQVTIGSIIAAQQAAMIAAIGASSAASAASSS